MARRPRSDEDEPERQEGEPEQLAGTTATYAYVYAISGSAPTSGEANQSGSGSSIIFNNTDNGGTDRTAVLQALNGNDTISAGGVTWNIIGWAHGSSTTTFQVAPTTKIAPGLTNFSFFTPDPHTVAFFPSFTPIVPPPPIGQALATPTFPPPTPPPIGTVPKGPLVGPAIAPAAVPPSLAGVVQPQYKTGSATAPPANGYFPQFTTGSAYAGFPNNPPAGVPIVFSNISTNPSKSGGVWTVITPPSTPTVAQITLNGMSILVPHMVGEDDAGAVRGGHAEPAERSAGAVLSDTDADELHQPEPPPRRGGERMSARRPAGRGHHR